MYHRVAETDVDPWDLCVTPEHFEEHMEVLTTVMEPVHLADIRQPSTHRPLVAVTFDDGYADNLLAARPVLQRFAVPATVFVSTGFTGSSAGFWWDRLEEIFLHPGSLPLRPLTLNITGSTSAWNVDKANEHYTALDCRRYRGWVAYKTAPPTSRHSIFYEVWKRLIELPHAERERQLKVVDEWAGRVTTPKARSMSEPELREMFKDDLINAGGHTVNHCRLASLSPTEQRDEIEGSRGQLESWLSRRVADFSYPFGGHGDYTSDTVEAVAASGYERACTNYGGVVGSNSNNLELPRVLAGNLSGAAFRRWLSTVIRI